MYEFYTAPAIMPYCGAVMLMVCYFCMQIVQMRTRKYIYLKHRPPLLIFLLYNGSTAFAFINMFHFYVWLKLLYKLASAFMFAFTCFFLVVFFFFFL